MKKVLITGASRGIGLAISDELQDKYTVIGISKSGNNNTLKFDLSNQQDLETVKNIECDILINCAGISNGTAKEVYDVNVFPLIELSEINYNRMESGIIINIGSVCVNFDINLNRIPSSYHTSKVAVKQFTNLLSDRKKPNLSVTHVELDMVQTDLTAHFPERVRNNFHTPKQIAKTISWIIDAPKYPTISNIVLR
jgi:short-subunit dehydrogenase